MISVKVLADSTFVDVDDIEVERVVTWQVRMPKRLLQELNTHGTVARNAASMRAIPGKRFRENATYERTFWGKAQPGMQSDEKLPIPETSLAISVVEDLRQYALKAHEKLEELGVHKQMMNPYLEPFVYAEAIITLTSQQMDFFYLRANEATEPDFAYVATLMLGQWIEGYKTTVRKSLFPTLTNINTGEQIYVDLPEDMTLMHLPFGIVGDYLETLAANVASVARVSYMNHEGKYDFPSNLTLFHRLFKSKHMSPFEHVCWGQHPTSQRTNRMSRNIMTLRYSMEQLSSGWQPPLKAVYNKMVQICKERGYEF